MFEHPKQLNARTGQQAGPVTAIISMLVALHKGKTLISRLIRWQTRSEYSHASLILDDGTCIEAVEGHGVRQQVLWRPTGHAPIDLFMVGAHGLSRTAGIMIERWARSQIGKPYDWTMVVRFVSRRQASRKESGKWFCSELVFAALQKGGVDLLERVEPWEVSPGLLSKSPLLTKVQSL